MIKATYTTREGRRIPGTVIGNGDVPGFYRFRTAAGQVLSCHRNGLAFGVETRDAGNDASEPRTGVQSKRTTD